MEVVYSEKAAIRAVAILFVIVDRGQTRGPPTRGAVPRRRQRARTHARVVANSSSTRPYTISARAKNQAKDLHATSSAVAFSYSSTARIRNLPYFRTRASAGALIDNSHRR